MRRLKHHTGCDLGGVHCLPVLICALYGDGYRRPGTSLVAKASGSVVVSLARCDVGQPGVINSLHVLKARKRSKLHFAQDLMFYT